jgi:tetratricopeptide (TPR) repeat protein
MRYWIALLCLTLAAAEDPAALSEQAQRLAGQQRFQEAERLWLQAIALSPEYYPALFNLGLFYSRQQKFAEAAGVLERAAHASRGEFNAWYLWGTALSKLGRTEDALRAWREALNLQPKNQRLMQVMSVEYYKGRYFMEAAKLARAAMDMNPDDLNGMFLAIKAYQVAGDEDSASQIARRAVERFPDSARANFEHAYHLQKQGNIADAEVHLKRAMKADPAYEEPFFFYGNLLVDQDRSADAIPYLEKAIRNRADYVPARVVLARALMNLNQWPQAIAALNETVALDPKHPQPHLLLSQIFFRMGDEAKAKAEKDISLRLRRENPTILEAAQGRPFPDGPGR